MGNWTDDTRGGYVRDQIDNREGRALTIPYSCLLVYYVLHLSPVSVAPYRGRTQTSVQIAVPPSTLASVASSMSQTSDHLGCPISQEQQLSILIP